MECPPSQRAGAGCLGRRDPRARSPAGHALRAEAPMSRRLDASRSRHEHSTASSERIRSAGRDGPIRLFLSYAHKRISLFGPTTWTRATTKGGVMSVSPALRPLPPRPSLEYERKEAKALLRRLRAGDPEAQARARHPGFSASDPPSPRLADAQLVIAREYGFASWPRLVRWFGDVERQQHAHTLCRAPGMRWWPATFPRSNAS